MRLVLLSLLLFSTVLSSTAQVNLTQGLMAWYPFNGNAVDSSGNGNNASFNNAVLTADRFGVANHAYAFNGVNTYMQIPNSTSLNMGNTMSICAWVKVNGFNYASCHGNSILYKSDVNAGPGNYGIQFGDIQSGQSCSAITPDTLHETFYGMGTAGNYPTYIQKNNWYFLVMTYNGTTTRFYINGKLTDSITTPISNFTNSYDLFIGKFNYTGGSLYWLNGALDDIRIYNRAINQAEVNALYTPPTPTVSLTQGLMAYYPFNGNAGDSSGNANHAVFNNATLTTDRFGNANSAYAFNGTNTYMKVLNSPSLNVANSISICAWVKVTGFNYASCHGNRILYKSDVEAGSGNYGIDFSDRNCATSTPDTTHELFYGDGTLANYTSYVQKNNWYFLVSTFDGKMARTYINNQLVDSNATTISSFTNGYDLYIGKLNSSGGLYYLNGVLDDIRIYSRALSQSDISALYTPAPPSISLTQGLMAYYPFNGNANDSSGNNNNPTYNNATLTTDRFGVANHAYAFNGVNTYMKVPNSASLGTGNVFTLSAWVKISGFTYGACHSSTLFYKSDVEAGPGSYGLEFSDVAYTNGQNCSVYTPDTLHETFYSPYSGGNASPYAQKNAWTLVTVTYDGQHSRLYIDGRLSIVDSQYNSSFTNAYDLYIGKLNYSTGYAWFNGALDDIRLYNRALNQNEISALYTPSINEGMIAWYKFDGNTADSSGNGNHASVNTNTTLTTDRFGNTNKAYSFNGTSSYMMVPTSATLNIANSISICTWLKVSGFNYGTCHGNVPLFKGLATNNAPSYGLIFSDVYYTNGQNCTAATPDTLHQTMYGTGALGYDSSYITKNNWAFFVVTFDGSIARMYMNGVLIDSNTYTISSFTNAYNLFIGRYESSQSTPYWYNGAIDDIRIYARALNQSEINALYTPGTTTLPVNLLAFTATKDKKDVDLSWQVATEINHDYYEVERSFDATNYSSITKVTGIYNNSGGSYTYTDANILSLATSSQIYYRLKMVSKTGDITYSNTVHVSTGSTISEVNAYPNPFQDHLVLNMTFQKSGPVGITITDMSGKTVSTQTIQVAQGNTTININNLAHLAKGLYMLRITNAETVITKKILKGE